ncbi:ribose 5-phosphate isomerase A [Candidatus Bathyarchaeota archaeon]|nr:MAG: ribose 5-phosphate isomerase A [Candidatus Bathyarchaeota archaeon]
MRRENVGWREEAKKKASLEAVKHIKDGFTIGLGSGSTVAYTIQEIGKRIQQRKLRILGVPTSHQAMMLAVHCGIPITTLNEHPQLDLTIDGADQIDRHLDLIKGMGGALTREKIVASATKQFVIVADETKLIEKLGANCAVPVEVLPFALPTVMLKMQEKGGKPVLREAKGKVGPVVTDNGNFIVDVDFGHINAPKKLDSQLKSIPGIIETGLFIGMADIVYVGTRVGTVQKLESK